MTGQLIGNKVLVEPIQEEVKTESGLILEKKENSPDDYKKGKVISVGDGKEVQESKLAIDNEVIYQYGKTIDKIDGKIYIVVELGDMVWIF